MKFERGYIGITPLVSWTLLWLLSKGLSLPLLNSFNKTEAAFLYFPHASYVSLGLFFFS